MTVRPPQDDDAVETLVRRSRSVPGIDPMRPARVRAAVHGEWVSLQAARRRRRTLVLMSGAAAAVVALGILWTLVQPGGPGGSRPVLTPASVAGTMHFATGVVTVLGAADDRALPVVGGAAILPGTTVSTGDDGRGLIALNDGVELRLDRDTSLRIDSAHAVALERGAIYIDTTPRHGPATPIDVTAHGVLVRDIGTRYEVRLSGAGLRVRVRDGRVQLTRDRVVHDAAAGTELLAGSTDVRRSPTTSFGPDWDWITRAARPRQIEGRSLGEFLDWVAREGGRRVRFADATLEQRARTTVVYGTIAGLSVEEALEVVLPSCGLRHRIEGDVITIETAERGRR